jgi:hypothetical protein
MDDNARPHHSRAVPAYLQSEAVTSVPWLAMSPHLNLIEHIWNMLGRCNQLSSDQWILRRAKHHAKRDRRCRSANSGRLMTLLDLSPADSDGF